MFLDISLCNLLKKMLSCLGQLVQTGAAVCYCSYAFLTGPDILKYVQYFDTLEYRLPKVVDMISSFISNIVDSNKFKVTLPSVT